MTRRETVGQRLRRLRVAQDLTQEELAGDQYSAAYVSQIEAERRQPSHAVAEHFADRLGVDVDYLLTGRDPQLETRLTLEVQEARSLVYQAEWELAEASLKRILTQAKREGFGRVRVKAFEALGLLNERQGLVDEALEAYQSAAEAAEEFPIPVKAGAVTGMARCFQQLGDHRYSAHLLESYLLDLQKAELTEPSALMRIYASLVGAYFQTGMTEKAIEAAREAKRLEVRVAEPEHVACMNINIARVFLYDGNTKDAIAALTKAEEIFATFGWRNEVARANLALGIVHAQKEDFERAREFFHEALELLAQAPNPLDEARTRDELARLERLTGNHDEARKQAELVLALVPDRDASLRACAYRELALISLDDRDKAEEYFQTAIDLFRVAKDRLELVATFRALGDMYARYGDQGAMAQAYRQGIEAAEERSY